MLTDSRSVLRQGAGRTAEVSVEESREGAKAQSFVEGCRLEEVGHRLRMVGGNRHDQGRDARRV